MVVTIDGYQRRAAETAVYTPTMKVVYPALGLAGEVGEFCNKLKKVYRDRGGEFDEDTVAELRKELGGVLWYIAQTATDLGICLADCAQENLEILASRRLRGTIHGSGDDR